MDKTGKNIQIKSQDLREKNKKCLADVERSNNDFYYFTSCYTTEKILSSDTENYIYVSPISAMNDMHERDLHSLDGNRVFGLCFCNSDIDEIPMWYLYGGISGKGARIGITAKKMRDLIANIDHIYTVNNGHIGHRLEIGQDFKLEYGWIFYRKDANMIEYRNQRYSLFDRLEDFEQDNFFVKDMEWKYEKEFRIVFHIHGIPPEKIAFPLNKKILVNRNGGLKVMLAPELRPETTETLEITREAYANKFGLPRKKVSFSELKIKMDLIARNQYVIIDNFSDVLDKLKIEDIKKICKQIQSKDICTKEKELSRL